MRGYLLLIQKDSVTLIHSVTVYVKEELPFARGLYLKISAGFFLIGIHSMQG